MENLDELKSVGKIRVEQLATYFARKEIMFQCFSAFNDFSL